MPVARQDQLGVDLSMLSGKAERLPYSLSRWTDVPAAKWPWFKAQLAQGYMVGFDPRTGIPARWSLAPEDVHGLILWTKDPRNLLADRDLLKPYPLVVHVTLTGWTEAEKNAPGLRLGMALLRETVEAFGPERVVWRFSPIPQLPIFDIIERFSEIAEVALCAGLKRVYVAFLQHNDRMPEKRTFGERRRVLLTLGSVMENFGGKLDVILCQDDQETLARPFQQGPACLKLGVCEDGAIFGGSAAFMDCGCAHAVDPFTVNESCTMGCAYCYAADRGLAPKKRNTTLQVIR
jgi:hypothetical protein